MANEAVHSKRHRRLRLLAIALILWAVASYLLLPFCWKAYFGHDAKYTGETVPRITRTADEHPGDPINLAIVGPEAALIRAMTAAGWTPADPITLDSSVRIAVDTVFRKPDAAAPVSNLYLFGRQQDLAFEQPVGDSPRQRHHVRFWRWDQLEDGQPVWFGAATFDRSVGLSHTTGQITHHIAPEVDAERDRIATELERGKPGASVRYIDNFQQPAGDNGGGDRWRSDGRLAVVTLAAAPAELGIPAPAAAEPATAENRPLSGENGVAKPAGE
jgi:hypothetical protein